MVVGYNLQTLIGNPKLKRSSSSTSTPFAAPKNIRHVTSPKMQSRMVSRACSIRDSEADEKRLAQLSKEDEAAAEEVEVRREDQEKINKFSRLHQRESLLEEQLKQKQV